MSLLSTEKEDEKRNKTVNGKFVHTGAKKQRNIMKEPPEHKLTEDKPYKMEIIWFRVFAFLMMHLGALYAIYLCFFAAKFLTPIYAIFMIYVTILGITLGTHRLYSHRAFKANNYIQFISLLVHTMAGQSSLYTWVRGHRIHHKHSDTNADPQNSSRGLFFSHIGWLMVHQHPDVAKKSKSIDMSDLDKDHWVMFQKKYFRVLFFLVSIFIPVSIPCLLWNETVWNSFFISFVGRLTGSWNLLWSINSLVHVYGTRPYTKDLAPAENPFVSFFVLGEGMHNYHHTFPLDYRASEHINITTRVIDYCIKKGWASDPKCVSPDLIKRQAAKKGDSSHPAYHELNPNGIARNKK